MDIRSFQKLVVETVEAPLYAYLQEEPECGFSKRDIKKCKNLMFSYLGKLKKITAVTDEKILKQVKKTVLALNKLNERTDYCLLETDEREALWEIFQNSAIACGIQETDGDVTEEWREW